MNLIKTTIATAAVITCCLGSTYPATAELSAREESAFRTGYKYGYLTGLLAEACVQFMFGHVSESEVERVALLIRDSTDLDPYFKRKIASDFAEAAGPEVEEACNPTVQRILSTAATRSTTQNFAL